jgi:hypothetical protein
MDVQCAVRSITLDSERTLAYLVGLSAKFEALSTTLSPDEVLYSHWLQSELFNGGLQMLQLNNPFNEDKEETGNNTGSVVNWLFA